MTGSGDKMKIDPEALADAAASAGKTTVNSVPTVIAPPVAAGASPIDLAAATAAATIEGVTQAHSTADNAAAVKQLGALSEFPTVLVAQDHQDAGDMTAAGGSVPVFPMPAAGGGLAGGVKDA